MTRGASSTSVSRTSTATRRPRRAAGCWSCCAAAGSTSGRRRAPHRGEDGFRDAQAILDGAISGQERRDGWTVPFAHTAEPGPWVLEQAVTQLRAIGSNAPAEAVYMFADADADGRPLDPRGGAVHELRFAGDDLPPLEDGGFWSVTMYRTTDSLLVDSRAGRYATRLDDRASFVTQTTARRSSWRPSGRRASPRRTGCRHPSTSPSRSACASTTRGRRSVRAAGRRRRCAASADDPGPGDLDERRRLRTAAWPARPCPGLMLPGSRDAAGSDRGRRGGCPHPKPCCSGPSSFRTASGVDRRCATRSRLSGCGPGAATGPGRRRTAAATVVPRGGH